MSEKSTNSFAGWKKKITTVQKFVKTVSSRCLRNMKQYGYHDGVTHPSVHHCRGRRPAQHTRPAATPPARRSPGRRGDEGRVGASSSAAASAPPLPPSARHCDPSAPAGRSGRKGGKGKGSIRGAIQRLFCLLLHHTTHLVGVIHINHPPC